MTYKDLLEHLKKVEEELNSDEKLNQNVTVYVAGDDYFPVNGMYIADGSDCDVLDPGHLVLATGCK